MGARRPAALILKIENTMKLSKQMRQVLAEIGRIGGSKPKNYSKAERARRSKLMREVTKARVAKQRKMKARKSL